MIYLKSTKTANLSHNTLVFTVIGACNEIVSNNIMH